MIAADPPDERVIWALPAWCAQAGAAYHRKWPQLGGKLGPKSGRNNAGGAGMTLMWVRNRPGPIKFGFRESGRREGASIGGAEPDWGRFFLGPPTGHANSRAEASPPSRSDDRL